jgi:polyketide biosynthesis enoyl-CoA hydratase PksH
MDLLNTRAPLETLRVRFASEVCTVQLHRPNDGNTICDRMVQELTLVLDQCEESAKVVVVEGLPEVFCLGADFNEIERGHAGTRHSRALDPEPLYELWLRLAFGPYISVAHVMGRTNAGGVGFVAACDVALGDESATFSLSELLFGLMPACVLPFLARRTGPAKAHYMTVTTQPVTATQACAWGLLDACESHSDALLRKQLVRLQRLSKLAIARHKRYMSELDSTLHAAKAKALRANAAVFGDEQNLQNIVRYVRSGQFPWES